MIAKVFTLYTLVVVAVGLIISVLSPIVIPLISDAAYHTSYKLVPLICLAAIFYGMASVADAGILISKKTFYKPILFGAAGIVAFVLSPTTSQFARRQSLLAWPSPPMRRLLHTTLRQGIMSDTELNTP